MQLATQNGASYTLAGQYDGEVVQSETAGSETVQVLITPISRSVIRVSFPFQGHDFHFRGITRETEHGLVIYIQDIVTGDYVLSGVSGFLKKMPEVHGGLVSQLGGLYFHIMISYYKGQISEFYFFGKK